MNGLINRVFFCVFLWFFYGCNNSSQENIVDFERTISEQDNVFTIPKEIKNAILRQFPSVEIIKKEEYSKLFWDFYDSSIIPNECFTDVNNDQLLDYAILVREGNKLKLVIILSDNKDYSYWISPFSIEKITAEGVNFCVSIKPAGRTDVVKKVPESLVIKKNGFLVRNLEQDHFVFYEENGKIKNFKML
ncbi:hypothetical protein [Flavobacterium limi]|uniref:Beta-lactamase-inhibitor-like, PepSY-like n=1 Tax=Flavobacterium limi TaxID=2045105 RepID=A0ABQ1TLM4_9FLAO|nr:hypothetical protein [Flavobacterium limi]GGE98574.1 hypothetical protein GCM10011518_04960 [Flavobacterium limi]